VRGNGNLGRGRGKLTRYQPVGFPVSPNLSWEVRTKRTFGAILELYNGLLGGGFDLDG
jgi:hypothetical protein